MPDARVPSHGFRFSWTDALVLAVGAALTWALWQPVGQFALLVPVTLVHFFLFCNVFRVGNRRELLWTGVFVANFTSWVYFAAFSWWGVLVVQAPVTLGIVVAAVRDSRYHGVFSRRRPEEAKADTAAARESGR